MFDKLIPWKRHENENRLTLGRDSDPVSMLRRDFENLLGRFWEEGGLSRLTPHWPSGAIDVNENDKEYVLTAELPGFDPSDIDVKVSGNVLTIKAEHKEMSDDSHGRMRRYGSFYETFTLPTGVKDDAIDAHYHSGVLELLIPKDESKVAKRIEVKAA
ncbi:MAG: Hsp20/alpha crystallin family protein [Planctomycetaceae bacterium]|jgi:HSP20 family protein